MTNRNCVTSAQQFDRQLLFPKYFYLITFPYLLHTSGHVLCMFLFTKFRLVAYLT